ncbi:MAG: hypothetical protein KU37_10950 [Sulfuricurvum sp. PC08-66]|nr:MAG: hypothetical protein KU37_10950 [Sulfuricurvum sp. PC08-66]
MEYLIVFGFLVGVSSGFFGIGGGTLLVPLLMMIGFTIKEAVGISIVQMLFSSISGSTINYRKGQLEVKIVLLIALGGLVGAYLSAYWVPHVSNEFLEGLFLVAILFATFKIFMAPHSAGEVKQLPFWALLLVGAVIGTIAIAIGVGGSLLVTPFLNAYLGYPIKRAINAALFYVLFSSSAAFVSWGLSGQLLLHEGLIVGVVSMVGVWVGIYLGSLTSSKNHKTLLLILNISVIGYMGYRFLG